MKIFNNKIVQMIIYFVIIICVFVLLLVISSLFPSKYIRKNVEESSQTLLKQQNDFRILLRLRRIKFDNYSDALMINTAYSIDNTTPLYSSFTAKKNYDKNYTKIIYEDTNGELKWDKKYNKLSQAEELRDILEGKTYEAFEYARYWHGYLTVIRPLLLVFNITQIRVISITIINILAAFLIYLIAKRINIRTAIAFFIAMLSADLYIVGISIQGMFIFYIMLIASLIVIKKEGNFKNLPLFFMIIGMFTCYLDLLTNPILTYALPITLIFLFKQKKNESIKVLEILKLFLIAGISWLIGYALTWMLKWILFDIIYDRNLISVALGQVKYRSMTLIMKLYANTIIFNFIMNVEFIFLFVALFSINLIIFGPCKKEGRKICIKINEILPYVIITIIPFVWYFVLKNHTYLHNFFTYRTNMLTILGLFLISSKIFVIDENKGKNKKLE